MLCVGGFWCVVVVGARVVALRGVDGFALCVCVVDFADRFADRADQSED